VALDSTFAMAWRKLGVALANNGMPRAQVDSAATKAYENRDRLTEYEAANAVGYYYQSGPGRNRQKAIDAYAPIVAKVQADPAVHNSALLLSSRREFARAESLYRRVITAGGAPVVSYSNLESVLFDQGKIAEADSMRRVTEQLFPNSVLTIGKELPYLYHRGELDSMEAAYARVHAHRDPRTQAGGWYGLMSLHLLRGRVRESLHALEQARQIDSARGLVVPTVQDSIWVAFVDLLVEQNRERAIRRFDRALATLPESQRTTAQISFFHAAAGQPERAREVFERDEAQERDSIDRRLAAPLLHLQRGEVLLAEGKPIEAVAEFRASDTTVDGPINSCTICIMPRLGRAFDRAGMADSAIAWYERYLDTPMLRRMGFDLDVTSVPQISRRLGELYEAKGDRQKAAAYYQKFVDLWKNADPHLQPQVTEIRQRLARLTDPERPHDP
jgi:tetratricopeptide (TPR) repeat protein